MSGDRASDAAGPALDVARAPREGESLDVERLVAWLESHVPDLAGPALEVLQFPSGHSNLTYLLRQGDEEAVLRRPPFGSRVKAAHDMGREHRVLSALAPRWPLAPAPLAMCDDEDVIGAPFYLCERRRGVVYRREPPRGVSLDEERCAALSRAFVDTLAALHAFDCDELGLSDFGRPEGYVERQVSGWARRYGDAATDVVEDMDALIRWLEAERPVESGAALIHNDFKFDNMMFAAQAPTVPTAVLDWEMSTRGDPHMDLGTALGYWVEAGDPAPLHQARFGPTHAPGSFTRAELVAAYEARTGRSVEHPVFYYAFGLFKIAVVAQQIYARYAKGLTNDARFAGMLDAVRLLARQANAAIGAGRISGLFFSP